MKNIRENSGENNMFLLLIGTLITGFFYYYRNGISGNDFWWHIKAGEWIVKNRTVPTVDIFSWYGKEAGLPWVSHEWLSEVFFYFVHKGFGNLGIFLLSLFAAQGMAFLIIKRNRKGIRKNALWAFLYLCVMVFLFPGFFYGRPQLISYFLLYAVLYCLYEYRKNESSRLIYVVPVISALWGNFHGGSSNLPYILCFLFLVSGLFELSIGRLQGSRYSKRQMVTFLAIGVLSALALLVNPQGLKILEYPFANMKDSFMQTVIAEWAAPDAKIIWHLLILFVPMFMVAITLLLSEKKIELTDLLIFLFFSYLFFRSTRFGITFYLASTFYVFEYFLPRKVEAIRTKLSLAVFDLLFLFLVGAGIFSIWSMYQTYEKDELISVALDQKFVDLVRQESPERLYNDYNFGETLIYAGLDTFVDGRADVFTAYNLRDAMSLMHLTKTDENEDEEENGNKKNVIENVEKKKEGIFDPEELIERYDFDAFLIQTDRSLAVYLKSRPEKYQLLLEDEKAVYFKTIN